MYRTVYTMQRLWMRVARCKSRDHYYYYDFSMFF